MALKADPKGRDSKGNQRRRHLKSMVGCLLLAGCTTSQSGGWPRSQLGTALSTQCCPRLCRPCRFAPGRLVAVLRPPPYKRKEKNGSVGGHVKQEQTSPLNTNEYAFPCAYHNKHRYVFSCSHCSCTDESNSEAAGNRTRFKLVKLERTLSLVLSGLLLQKTFVVLKATTQLFAPYLLKDRLCLDWTI